MTVTCQVCGTTYPSKPTATRDCINCGAGADSLT